MKKNDIDMQERLKMNHENRIAEIALELQAITRSGLTYVKDPYDNQ